MPGMEPMSLMSKMFPDVGTNSDISLQADAYDFKIKIRQARNAIFQAESELRALDVKLSNTRSMAPFNGVIMQKFIEQGDTVQPGMPLLKFADIQYLQVSVDVPARLRQGLKESDILDAEFDVGNEREQVRVAQIYPMADAERHTVKVKFDIPTGVSSPGMYAKIFVPDSTGPSSEILTIPTTAIIYNGSLPAVYIKGTNNKPELRLIRVGEKTEKQGKSKTAVLSGLRLGEEVSDDPKNIKL
jgi:RND family efflux transporter MFP subunit